MTEIEGSRRKNMKGEQEAEGTRRGKQTEQGRYRNRRSEEEEE